MYEQYWCARTYRAWAWSLGATILCLWILNSLLAIAMNNWTRDFFDELQRAIDKNDQRSAAVARAAFEKLMWEWLYLSVPAVLLMPIVNLLTRVWAFQWRQALTDDYLHRWRIIAKGSIEVESASQRVQEDTYRFARLIDSLGQGFLSSVLQLISFSPLLWELSSGLPGLPDGVLVYVSVLGNTLGVGMSFLVGYHLVSLEYNNQKVEASFRKELVYAEDNRPGYGGIETCHALFQQVRENYMSLFQHLCLFEVWINLYDRAMAAVPILLMAPVLYSGELTLGSYMQAISAFEKVQGSLSVLMHRWIDINELRAVARRLNEFERLLPDANAGESSSLVSGKAGSYGTATKLADERGRDG